MNVYRHKNGGGLKVYPAQASPDSYIDARSTVEGESNLYASSLMTQGALKDCFVAWSRLIDITAADCRISDAYVQTSDLVSSDVVSARVVGCRLKNCRVFGDDGASPTLKGVMLDGVTVSGGAICAGYWGLELEGAHIHAGEWNEQPRHLALEGDGVHVAVLECTEGRAHMGCTCRPTSYWLERGPKLGRRLGWSEEMIDSCLTFLRSL